MKKIHLVYSFDLWLISLNAKSGNFYIDCVAYILNKLCTKNKPNEFSKGVLWYEES